LIGKILVPETVTNLAFGGPKRNRLFITQPLPCIRSTSHTRPVKDLEAKSLDLSDIKCIISCTEERWRIQQSAQSRGRRRRRNDRVRKFPRTDEYGLAAEAFRNALADCHLDKSKIDGLLTCRIPSYSRMGEVLGLDLAGR